MSPYIQLAPLRRTGRRARLKDVAVRAKVSVATVSMALADHPDVSTLTKQRVREISRQLGYRRGAASSGQRLGLVFAGLEVEHQVNSSLIFHLTHQAPLAQARIEYEAISGDNPLPPDDEALAQRVLQFCEHLDGVLLNGAFGPVTLGRLRAAQVPHVMLGHAIGPICPLDGGGVTKVAFDDVGMGYAATRWLLERGQARVAFVSEFTPRGQQHDRWRYGYQLAHVEAAMPIDPALIVVTGEPESGAEPAMKKLLALERPPTAYVVPDARIAGSLVAALRRRGVELPLDALVFTGTEPTVKATGMGQYPHLIGRADLMAQHALSQLQRLCRQPDAEPVEALVPFKAFNLSNHA